jgi:hypothetical protein
MEIQVLLNIQDYKNMAITIDMIFVPNVSFYYRLFGGLGGAGVIKVIRVSIRWRVIMHGSLVFGTRIYMTINWFGVLQKWCQHMMTCIVHYTLYIIMRKLHHGWHGWPLYILFHAAQLTLTTQCKYYEEKKERNSESHYVTVILSHGNGRHEGSCCIRVHDRPLLQGTRMGLH